jgi:uncharacterized repeat protein (TIGR01451 family)
MKIVGTEHRERATWSGRVIAGVFVILVLSLTGSVALAKSASSPQPLGAPRASLPDDPTPASLSVWHDPRGDLWVAGPHYQWNITGGLAITTTIDGAEYAWHAGDPTALAVDELFLAPASRARITSQIFFALPDEALVYLERAASNGESREGLEIAFRSSDGLIRLTHRWQGADPPSGVAAPPISLSGEAALSERASADSHALTPGGYSYAARLDPSANQGYATIWARRPAAAGAPDATGAVSQPCAVNPGSAPPTSYDRCQFPNFFLPGQALATQYLYFYAAEPAPSDPLETVLSALQLELPDLDAAYIMRTPRYPYDGSPNQPAPGEPVAFQAKIADRGGRATGSFEYTWLIDDAPVSAGAHASLAPGEAITLTLNWVWQEDIHKVAIVLDPANRITEVSEQNNQVEDRTNGLAAGFWVEQSVYDWMNLHQVEQGFGSVSWEDWAQRQLRVWNQMLASAVHPLTPDGAVDRLRLDKVTIVPDNSLPRPYPGNFPDTGDKTVDLMWGFAYELVLPPDGWYLNDTTPLNVEYSLLHELSHARYLLDLYGLNVGIKAKHLQAAVNSTATSLLAPGASDITLPAYLAIEGEMVVCSQYTHPVFSGCERGAGGTSARSHAANALVNEATVRLTDGQGNLVQGGPDLPIVSPWDDHIYYNIDAYDKIQVYDVEGQDLMNGGRVYGQHSAYAWNRIAGERPVCGNYNAPCNIGEYINDLPQHMVVELRGKDDQPLAGANVELYRRRETPGLYGKLYEGPPDIVATADSNGQVDFGHDLFATERIWESRAVCLLKITAGGATYYRFLEATVPNQDYWAGAHDRAVYPVKLGLSIENEAPAAVVPGAPITYTLTAWNTGKAGATNAVISSSIPTGATYISGGQRSGNTVQWTVSSIPAHDFSRVQFVVMANETITNTSYGARSDGGMVALGRQPIVTKVITPLQIRKSAPHLVPVGAPITYTLRVENRSAGAAKNVVVSDALPPGATYLSGGARNGNEVLWSLPTLPKGGLRIMQFAVTATQTITNSTYCAQADGGLAGCGTAPVIVRPTPCHSLTVNVSPAETGVVSAVPAPNCGGGTRYLLGTRVCLTATANRGNGFDHWSGDVAGSTNPDCFIIDGDTAVTTNFVLPFVQISSGDGPDNNPALVSTAGGRFVAAWDQASTGMIWLGSSPDGGATWSTRTLTAGLRPALLAAQDGRLWLAYERDGDIWARTSPDEGVSWSEESNLTDSPASDAESALAQTQDGALWLVWMRPLSAETGIFFMRSQDNGASWLAASALPTPCTWCGAPNITQAADGKVWVVWWQGYDFRYASSSDNGATWTPDSCGLSGHNPRLRTGTDGRLWLSWSNIGWFGGAWPTRLAYRTSSDNGVGWTEPREYTVFSGENVQADIAVLADGQVAFAWRSNRSGAYNIWFGSPGVHADTVVPPSIMAPAHMPQYPTASQEVTFTAAIADTRGIQGAWLRLTINGVQQADRETFDDGVSPDAAAGDGVYTWRDGPFAPRAQVVYQFRAEGKDGLTAQTPPDRAFAIPAVCYMLTTDVSPAAGGRVVQNPQPDCNGGSQYMAGAVVQLTALANQGYTFDRWSGGASGSANPVPVTMNGDTAVTASFTAVTPRRIFLPTISR